MLMGQPCSLVSAPDGLPGARSLLLCVDPEGPMNSFQWKKLNSIGVLGGVGLIVLTVVVAHAQTTTSQNDQPKIVQGSDQPNRVSIEYVAPQNPELQELYGLLRE